jgi:hypothetical protein
MSGEYRDDSAETTLVDLTDGERVLLDRGLFVWGGPARCTEGLAVAMGFEDVDDLLHRDGQRIRQDLSDRRALSPRDWARALLATEIVFASNVAGAGLDWSSATGLSDEETIALLRALQRKVPSVGI